MSLRVGAHIYPADRTGMAAGTLLWMWLSKPEELWSGAVYKNV